MLNWKALVLALGAFALTVPVATVANACNEGTGLGTGTPCETDPAEPGPENETTPGGLGGGDVVTEGDDSPPTSPQVTGTGLGGDRKSVV